MDASDHVSGVEKRLSMSGQEHKEANKRQRRLIDEPDHRGPQQEISKEALDRSHRVDCPGTGELTVAAAEIEGGVEEAGEDTEVGADVLEDGDGVEG